jgi:hypothetical protein
MLKPIEEMSDEEFLQHIQSLPSSAGTLEAFPRILAEIRRRNGGKSITREDYRALAEAYADSVVTRKK